MHTHTHTHLISLLTQLSGGALGGPGPAAAGAGGQVVVVTAEEREVAKRIV